MTSSNVHTAATKSRQIQIGDDIKKVVEKEKAEKVLNHKLVIRIIDYQLIDCFGSGCMLGSEQTTLCQIKQAILVL